MDILVPSYFMVTLNRLREYLLTRPWGALMNPISLARIFELVDIEKATKANAVKQATIGSEVKLLDKQTSTISRITLTEPENSNPNLGRISYLSLLGSELLGVVAGQKVSIGILGRAIDFQVLGIKDSPLDGNRR
jgi:transcription elongation GreA/GreB family factor